MTRHADTIAALSTPPGTAALAVIRVSGPDTLRLVTELVGGTPPPRQVKRTDYRSRSGELFDDVLITIFRGPRSYTGEDTLEVCCHGNPFIVQKILEDLFARGCRPAQPGEFTQRAFLNGRMDLTQAEAVMDVIHARSERALLAANLQLRGALGRRTNGLVDGLLGVLARVEAYIDFPEEDLPEEDRDIVRRELDRLVAETDQLLATHRYGELLRDGIRTVIVGEPNVGKSSLLNRMVGRERALVSPEPGTTRDYLEERLIVGPHCLRLIDTAGLNPSPTPLENLGMDKTRERVAEADLILLVLDAGRPNSELAGELHSLAMDDRACIVLNKSDLCNIELTLPSPFTAVQTIRTSALTGAGVDNLIAAVVERADRFNQSGGNEVVAVSARHSHALAEASASLANARATFLRSEPRELVACDLRAGLSAYGAITGVVDNERMLDHLFAAFCIGK